MEAALDAERERALEVAGVAPIAEERLRSTRRVRPGWGASFRDAMRRADFRARRDRGRDERERLAVAAALLGVLRADLGTVPRALAYAGVDRPALIARLERTLTDLPRVSAAQRLLGSAQRLSAPSCAP